MKEASKKIAAKDFHGVDSKPVRNLKIVADAFVDLQQYRHAADYSYAKKWSRTEVQGHIQTATDAFTSWRAIKYEKIALDYLMSLLVKERRD